MNYTIITIASLAVALTAYLISTYNWFVTAKTRIQASIQEIGNQLKRQADLIPNLEASAKGYLKHEKGILEALAEARKVVASAAKSSNLDTQAAAADALSGIMPQLSIIVESNPELKANTTVMTLMEELRDTSDKVMYARRTLIDLTADYNVRIVRFPTNLVASAFKLKKEQGLKLANMDDATSVSASDTKSPKISL